MYSSAWKFVLQSSRFGNRNPISKSDSLGSDVSQALPHHTPSAKGKIAFAQLDGSGTSRGLAAGAPVPQAWLRASVPKVRPWGSEWPGRPGGGKREFLFSRLCDLGRISEPPVHQL